jgi:hypothetical protein
MFHRLVFAAMALFLLTVTASARAQGPAADYGRRLVADLGQWDEEAARPKQIPAPGFRTKELLRSYAGLDGAAGLNIQVFYPQNTGSEAVDRILKDLSEKAMADYEAMAGAFVEEKPEHPGTISRTYAALRPSPDYLAVVFCEYIDEAGAHPNWRYEAFNFDLKKGRILTIGDIFPDGEKTQGFFVNHVNAALDRKCLADENGRGCSPHTVDMDDARRDIDKLILTPSGLTVLYSPYDQGPYSDGAKFTDIGREELAAWGAPDVFWNKR